MNGDIGIVDERPIVKASNQMQIFFILLLDFVHRLPNYLNNYLIIIFASMTIQVKNIIYQLNMKIYKMCCN